MDIKVNCRRVRPWADRASCWTIARMRFRLAAVVLPLIGRVGAVCPNMCNGHGECGLENKCECEAGWDLVADCSLKACPTGPSWGSKVRQAGNALKTRLVVV